MNEREPHAAGGRVYRSGVVHCATLAAAIFAATPAEVRAQDTATRIYFNDRCVVADEPFVLDATGPDVPKIPPFLGVLLLDSARSALATSVVRSAGQLLQRLGAERNVSSHVTQSIYLYNVESATSSKAVFTADLGCMTVVRAQFDADGAQCADDYVPKTLAEGYILDEPKSWQSTRAEDSRRNTLRRGNICVAAEPESVVEARFEYAEDGTAFRLVPVGYDIRSLESARKDDDVRTLVYTVSLTAPIVGKEPAVTHAALWLSLNAVRAGDESVEPPTAGSPPPWVRLPPLPAESRLEYDSDLAVHRELQGRIDALRRAGSRYALELEEFAAREAAVTNDAVRAALATERGQVAVKNEIAKVQLAAALREYEALPPVSKSYMPAMLVATANEVRSERAALTLVGRLLEDAAPFAGQAAGAMQLKSVESEISFGTIDGTGDIEATYYDLVVEQSLSRAAGAPTAEIDALVDAARRRMAEETRQQGLPQWNQPSSQEQ